MATHLYVPFILYHAAVNNFGKISAELKEKKAEYMKAKKFERMRKRLNKELAVQTNINALKSM